MNWKLEHRKGDPIKSEMHDWSPHSDTLYSRPGFQGGPGYLVRNAHQIRELHHVSGSGPLGGEKEWPHVTLDVAFPTGYEDLAAQMSRELRDFVDHFLLLNALDAGIPDDKG